MMPEPEYVTVWTGAHEDCDRDLFRPVEWDSPATVGWHTQENRPREGAGRTRRGQRGPDQRQRKRRSLTAYQAMRERLQRVTAA